MNATTPEPNEKPLERRESDGSGSSANDNPLMKLVDAALAPSNAKDDLMKPTLMDTTKKEESTDSVSKESSSTHSSDAGDSPGATASNGATATTQDADILKGTVQDLVSRQDKKLTFAEYLMQCLNDEANHDVLQWMPCGLQFTITNHRKFTMERMPSLFKIRNMSSFVRKLTRWGFSRVHEKETGNSDIFKHPLFQKDKPELCKKIRCVNRSTAAPAVPHKPLPPFMGHGGDMMGNISESSMRHGIHGPDMHMVSPRRSMGSMGSMGHGGPYMVSGGRPHYQTGRYAPPQPTPGGPPHPHHHPRVSPEYEKEMIQGNSFHPRHPGPPQVYSPPPIGRSMSAAAEYELEQVLLERQRARNAMYQHPGQGPPPGQHPQGQHQPQQPSQQQPLQQPQQHPGPRGPQPGGSPSLLGNGSERSMSSGATTMTADARGGGRYVPVDSPGNLASATNSVVTAALETLQREGDYEFDMSPREAMLRAVLHKRQQQRAAQQQQQQQGPPQQGHPQPQQQQHHPQQRQMLQQPPPRGPPVPPNGQVFVDSGPANTPPPPPPPPQGRGVVGPPPQQQQQPVYYR